MGEKKILHYGINSTDAKQHGQITPPLKSKNVETMEDPKWAPMLLMVFHKPSK